MIAKVIKELRRRMDAKSERLKVFNKELGNIKDNQTEMRNTITATKNAPEPGNPETP